MFNHMWCWVSGWMDGVEDPRHASYVATSYVVNLPLGTFHFGPKCEKQVALDAFSLNLS